MKVEEEEEKLREGEGERSEFWSLVGENHMFMRVLG